MAAQHLDGEPVSGSGSAGEGASANTASVPYEGALVTAFNKLTSQVLIFLLAYVILLIGIGIFGASLAQELRLLLYIVPVLGVAAYVWLARGRVRSGSNIDVRAGLAKNAYVGGIRGAGSDASNVKVRAGAALDGATVVGYDEALSSPVRTDKGDVFEAIQALRALDADDRRKVLAAARELIGE